jgi:predicted dehydrogenase
MSDKKAEGASISRREFIKTTGRVTGASALAMSALAPVHAAGSDEIRVALIGCGGRGSGAAVNALSTKSGPIKLVAMADVFTDRLTSSYNNLVGSGVGKLVDVPESRRFIGFDAYKKAMDCLKQGDVAIFTTPLAFRWPHFTYAIEKKLNVFMEKPLTADGPTSKIMLKLADESVAKNLKVGVGLMSRHSRPLQELHERIQNGELGDIILMRGYRMQGPVGTFESPPRPANIPELEYQIRRFHSFLWASGGCYNDFNIHHIDHLSWMKNAWPVKAQALGGRHYRGNAIDQNFDTYSVEYTFADGSKFFFDGRCMEGAAGIYASYVHGTKGVAVAARSGDIGRPSAIYSGQEVSPAKVVWESKDNSDPYQNEWDELIEAIRNNKPYNEVKRGVEASVVTSMGRMAAHTGQEITYDDMLNCEHRFAPDLEKVTMAGQSPLQAGPDGKYPVPMPGQKGMREY